MTAIMALASAASVILSRQVQAWAATSRSTTSWGRGRATSPCDATGQHAADTPEVGVAAVGHGAGGQRPVVGGGDVGEEQAGLPRLELEMDREHGPQAVHGAPVDVRGDPVDLRIERRQPALHHFGEDLALGGEGREDAAHRHAGLPHLRLLRRISQWQRGVRLLRRGRPRCDGRCAITQAAGSLGDPTAMRRSAAVRPPG